MLRHWFFLGIVFFRLFCTFIPALWRFRFRLEALLALPSTSVFSKTELKRIRHYYLGTSYLSVLFCSLRGSSRTQRERQLFFDLSALAAFFDDLVDEQRTVFRHGLVMTPTDPVAFAQSSDDRNIGLHLYQKLLQSIPPENLSAFQEYLQRLFALELAGQQKDSETNFPAIEQLTAEKGACAVLLFRCMLQPLPGEQETKAWREFGYLIQLSDDIFDLWFDRQKNVVTPATLLAERNQTGVLEALFEAQLARCSRAFSEVPVPGYCIKQAWAGVHALVAITRTCLFRYKQLAVRQGQLPLENRKLMVVDLEKWPNILRAMRFLLFSRPGISTSPAH
jgi:hypothetical protein